MEVLTPEQVAEKLQVAPGTVRYWLRSGQLPGIKVGKFWRVRPVDLETFLTPQNTLDKEKTDQLPLWEK